jgi:hypothetical protein
MGLGLTATAGVIGAIGGSVGAWKEKNFLKSDLVGEVAGVFQYIDPVFAPAILSAQEGYAQEDVLKKQARAVEAQARYDASQARQESLFRTGQEYLYFVRSGVFSGVGSPLDLLTQNALEREKEALAIRLKGINEGELLRTQGVNARRAAVQGAIHTMVMPLKQILSKVGLSGSSSLASTGATATGGVSYAGATAAGIDAAAGGAAAVNGAGTGLGALALV